MKKLLLILPVLIVFSCSIQKRKYFDGYYVEWNHKNKSKQQSDVLVKENKLKLKNTLRETAIPEPVEEVQVYASAGDKTSELSLNKKSSFIFNPTDSCDVLVFKDGSEVRAKVREIGINDVKYKKCDSPDGPIYITRKAELFMIKYANGTREVLKSEAVTPSAQRPSQSSTTYNKQRYNRETHPLAIASLVLGAASVIVGYVCLLLILSGYGLILIAIPFLLSLAAVISGKNAMDRIKEQPDLFKGKGLAIPGTIMGWIVLGISALILLITGLVLLLL